MMTQVCLWGLAIVLTFVLGIVVAGLFLHYGFLPDTALFLGYTITGIVIAAITITIANRIEGKDE